MEEKKLTDDEIVEGILQNIEYGFPITYIDDWGNCKDIMPIDILNLIERLKEQCSKSSFKDSWKNKFFKAQEEIERLAERKNELVEDKARWINKWKEQVECNAELQKQVDELKAKQVIECHGMLEGCDMVKQAVKDTAKEIYQELYDYSKKYTWMCLSPDDIEMFADKRGVEVE